MCMQKLLCDWPVPASPQHMVHAEVMGSLWDCLSQGWGVMAMPNLTCIIDSMTMPGFMVLWNVAIPLPKLTLSPYLQTRSTASCPSLAPSSFCHAPTLLHCSIAWDEEQAIAGGYIGVLDSFSSAVSRVNSASEKADLFLSTCWRTPLPPAIHQHR